MKYNAQCYDEKNKQHFMWVNSSELKSENRIMEIRYLFLSSLHIGLHTGDAKYRNYSRKIKTIANITIHKITERIESYTVLEATNDEGAIHLLINLKYTVMVEDTGSPIITAPHSKNCVLCETKFVNYQHKTEATADPYM